MLPFIEALNLILDDKAADHDDFRNIMISGNIDQKRITSLIKRQKISNIKFNVPNQEFSDLSECDRAGNLAAVFTNLEDGDIFIIKYGKFQSVEIKDIFVEIIRDRKLSLIIGEDDAAREVKIDLPEFTMILNIEPYQDIDQDIADLFPLKLIVGDHELETSSQSYELETSNYDNDDDKLNFEEVDEDNMSADLTNLHNNSNEEIGHMKLELKISYHNCDSGHTCEDLVSIDTTDETLEKMIHICETAPTTENFKILFRKMYDNPNMDGSDVGVLYNELWQIFSRVAFQKLGWSDVVVYVSGLSVNGKNLSIDSDEVDTNQWAIQLTHDGYMYCYY